VDQCQQIKVRTDQIVSNYMYCVLLICIACNLALPHRLCRTVFADTVLELDDAVGRIIAALEDAGLADNTLVLATGDNGPWQVKCELAGSPGPYTGAYQKNFGGGGTMKMTTWEGGHRVFGAASWPGRIPAGVVSDALVSTLDFVPTILSQAGVALPTDRQYDGVDLSPILFGEAQSVRASLYHPDGTGNLTAFRYNNYKLYWQTDSQPACNESAGQTVVHNPPLIFDLAADPSESTPVTLAPNALQTAITTWKSQMYNVSHTFRNIANYSEGGIPSSPCCNSSHVLCRCTD
jgi:arylsulfatase A-like enzyme